MPIRVNISIVVWFCPCLVDSFNIAIAFAVATKNTNFSGLT